MKTTTVILTIMLCSMRVSMRVLAQTPSGPIPTTLFGQTYFDPVGNWPFPPILSTGSLGKGTGVTWHYLQSSSSCPSSPCSTFDWYATDKYTAAAASHGVDFFYAFDNVPRWAVANTLTCGHNGNSSDQCTGMVSNLSDFTNYVTALVQRYDGNHGHGRIFIYEIWNEPTNPQDWTDTAANLAILGKEAVRIIRANDAAQGLSPPTIITTPSGGSNFLGSFMDAYVAQGGSPGDFDAVSLHDYFAVDGGSSCGGLAVPCAEAIIGDATAHKSQMNRHGLSGKPIFDTEGGFGNPADYGQLTSAQQVAFVARWYLLHWSNGISRMMWYAMDNRAWGTLCTGGPPCTLNAAGVAYNQTYNWLVGRTMSTPCSAKGTIWTCGLTGGSGYVAQAVWNTAGNSSYNVPSPYVQYRDLAGSTTATSPSSSITIGIQPLLLEGTEEPPPSPPKNLTVVVR